MLTFAYLVMTAFFAWLLVDGDQVSRPVAAVVVCAGVIVVVTSVWGFWRDRRASDDL